MGVRIDAHPTSKLHGAAMPAPIEVEAPWIGVDFDRDSMGRARGEDLLDVQIVTRPTQQLASGHVAENGRIGVGDGAKDTCGLRLTIETKSAVHAGDHKVEAIEHIVGVVEGRSEEHTSGL